MWTDKVRYLNVYLSPVHTSNNVEATFDFVVAKKGNIFDQVPEHWRVNCGAIWR